MDNVSRPLIALLVGTVAFFAVWLVALKPSSSSTSGTGTNSLGQYQSAINKAKQAVVTSSAASVAHGGTIATAPSPAPAAPKQTTAAPATSPTPTAAISPAATRRLTVVDRALAQHKVIALLFYNAAGADDVAVKQELAAVPTHGGRVVKLTAPLSELARYTVITSQVPVNISPTLVLVDPAHAATTIAGFADSFEIAQRVSDALAVR
jgi:hypothetical protein